MDLLSSSASMAVAQRDTSSGDDDAASSVTSGLAKGALLLFQSGKFADCLKLLNQLLQKQEGDPKILHNIAITECFQDGCSDPKRLLEVMNNVKKQSEELACISGETAEPANNIGGKSAIGAKGANNVVHQFSAANSSPIVYSDEFDTSVTKYNIAVTWFHLHEYEKSFSVLEPLYQNIEPIDEATAFRICLLMLDVSLLSHHVSRLTDVINYVERVFCASNLISHSDNGSSEQQAKFSSVPRSSTILDASNSDSAAVADTSESSLSRTLSADIFEDESYFPTLGISGRNVARPSSLRSANDLLRSQADDSISATDLRLKLHLYKVQFLLFTKNLKAAKREVKMAMNMARGKDYTTALFLKAQLEYARGNHRKAIKLLMATSNRTEIGISSTYYNNLGCIYYRLGKYHTSSIFFSKALNNCSTLRKEKPLKLSTFSQDKSLLIVYNCGVQYLACGKPLLAARCFHKASFIFYNWPLLWLRMAECCLMALQKGLVKSSVGSSDISEIEVHVIGKGNWRQLIIEDGISRAGQVGYVGRKDTVLCDNGQPNLSLSLARKCLVNSIHLLKCSESRYLTCALPSNSTLEENESIDAIPSMNTNHRSVSGGDFKASNLTASSGHVNANGELKEQKGGNSLNASLQSSISYYEEVCRKENHMIMQAVLADLAFVELELGNPLKALSTANSLLRLPECSRIYIFLGNLYAAEALCLLNRPKEAAEHLLMYMSGGNSIELPYNQEDCECWRVERSADAEELMNNRPAIANTSSSDESQGGVFLKSEEARGTLYANLASMYAVQGDIERAHQLAMQALSAIPNSPEAIITAIYVDLVRGKTQDALAKLKQCCHIRFLPGNLTVNSSS